MRWVLIFAFCSWSCAYRFGGELPPELKAVRSVFVDQVVNTSVVSGIEGEMTRLLVLGVARDGRFAWVGKEQEADAILSGEIHEVRVVGQGPILGREGLPQGATLWSQYLVTLNTRFRLVERDSKKVLWERSFSRSQVYQAPQIFRTVLNSSNAVYNQSYRLRTLHTLSASVANEALESLVGGF